MAAERDQQQQPPLATKEDNGQQEQHPFLALLHSKLAAKLGNHSGDVDDNNAANLGEWTLRKEGARWLDSRDPLRHLRGQFHFPSMGTLPNVDLSLVDPNEDSIYLCGNSLGLQPKNVEECVRDELRHWAQMGVHGHFHGFPSPWATCDEPLLESVARLVGAKSTQEIGLMNSLTVNIHLLFTAFFRPTPSRHKVLLEARAFPSDHYAIQSQLRLKGLDPAEAMLCLEPRPGEDCLRSEDILALLDRQGDSIALVFFGGLQYYTGQLFPIERVTRHAQQKGCLVGWDLAHAFGNVPLALHDWNVDFACWCSYKYACAGPGAIAGMFVHQRYAEDGVLARDRLLGWWGHRAETRFQMSNRMELASGAAGFRLSEPPALLVAALRASLAVFRQTSMEQLRQKSLLLTGYLEFLLDVRLSPPAAAAVPQCQLITPRDPAQRGCQLSLKFSTHVGPIFGQLVRRGVVVDQRHPNVIRVAPVHLYNSFEDVWRFVDALVQSIAAANKNE